MKMRFKKHLRSYATKLGQVKCTCCGQSHYQWWMITQGIGCASYLFFNKQDNQYQIEACYGSGYDTSRFNVLNNDIIYPKYLRAIEKYDTLTSREDKDLVSQELVFCDKCIENYIAKGYLSEDINYNSMAAVEELSDFWQEDPILYMELMKEAGPETIIGLIKEERTKPLEQRAKERELRESILSPQYVQSVKDNSIWF